MEMRHLLLAIAVGNSMATHKSPQLAHFNCLAIYNSISISCFLRTSLFIPSMSLCGI